MIKTSDIRRCLGISLDGDLYDRVCSSPGSNAYTDFFCNHPDRDAVQEVWAFIGTQIVEEDL